MKSFLQNKTVAEFIAKMPTIKQLFFSVFGALLLIFLLLSLLSYNPDDPAWSHFGNSGEITNIAGRLGAWVADILRVFFGLGAWWLVFVTGYELVRLWLHNSALIWQLRILAYGFLLLLLSGLLANWHKDFDQALYLGGVVGVELKNGLTQLMGDILPILFLVGLFLIVSTITFGIAWQKGFYKILKSLGLTMADKPADIEENSEDVVTDTLTPPKETNDEPPIHIIHHNHANTVEVTHHTEDNHNALIEFLQESGLKDEVLAQKHHTTRHYDVPHNKHVDLSRHQTQDDTVRHNNVVDTSLDNVSDSMSIKQHHHQDSSLSEVAQPVQQPVQSSLDSPHRPTNQAQRSHAMNTLQYRMSLSAIPELSLLDEPPPSTAIYSKAELHQLSELLEIKLQEYNISAKVMNAMVGPVITRFEVELAAGIKVNRVTKVAQDLARSMSMASLRVLPVIVGKPYIGIEVPNRHRQTVSLIELLNTPEYQDPNSGISIAIGADISGKPVIADLAKAPHMLVAGTTGSGKSVLVNSFLLSMLLKYTPDELKLVLIDPKQLELANYADIPHLLTPVITDMTEATAALNWCVNEMERRYQLMSLLRVRKLSEFNKKVSLAEQSGEPLFDPLWNPNDSVSISSAPKLKPLPQIVVVADEFADMIMQLGKTAEEPIVRLAQKSRAAGIHLILATQRPVASVVTGLIKSNIPSRVALRVNSATDSRIIIEEAGAENMLGHGDMMFLAPGKNFTERVHGAYVKDDEVNRITDAWRERGKPDYIDLSNSYTFDGEGSGDITSSDEDEYYQQAVAMVLETQKASASAFQRRFSIGYNRAARIMDMLEERGVVSKPDHSGKRQILI